MQTSQGATELRPGIFQILGTKAAATVMSSKAST